MEALDNTWIIKKRKTAKKNPSPSEEQLQVAVCRYLDFNYPNVIYTSDLSGIKLTMGQAVKAKKGRSKNFKIPDLLILAPSNGYHGLILELKKDRDELYKKTGGYKKCDRIQAQEKSLKHLRSIGYYATFSCGLEETIAHIEAYFRPKRIPLSTL